MQPKTLKRSRPRPGGTSPPGATARATPSTHSLARGQLLFDRYRLQRELGRGGVADVWEARDERLDRSVAIKVLHPHLLPDDAWRRRFVGEARAASGLTHPGIVPVYDVLDDPETPAIVFQLVDGESLAARLRREGRLPVADATRIAAQVAEALDHAHRAGLVHRDVKPANIVIDADGRARLIDFGIARVVEDASAEQTGAHEVVGTLRYMAPEQLAGKAADARTDLYALGLVIEEMLPDLADAPAWLRELVERLRAPDPADRPESAADVARALETGRIGLGSAPANPDAEGDPSAEAGTGAIAELDPDAVTRSYNEADLATDGPRSASASASEPAPESDAALMPASVTTAGSAGTSGPSGAAGSVVAARSVARTDSIASPGAAPVRAAPRRASRSDRRPIVVAVLVTGLVLGVIGLAQGHLFAGAAGSSPSQPAAAETLKPTPTQAPVAPATAPKPKRHGHGKGHG